MVCEHEYIKYGLRHAIKSLLTIILYYTEPVYQKSLQLKRATKLAKAFDYV